MIWKKMKKKRIYLYKAEKGEYQMINKFRSKYKKKRKYRNYSLIIYLLIIIFLILSIFLIIFLKIFKRKNIIFDKISFKNRSNIINYTIKDNYSLTTYNNSENEKNNMVIAENNILQNNYNNSENKNNNNNRPINNSTDYYSNFEEKKRAYLHGKEFFELCCREELKNDKTFIKSENPFISVIIPLYNCQKTIKKVIRSIQNQIITNLEIIVVNDLSTDNTTDVIQKMQKEDPRIIMINNRKNMGTLYSRCIGTLAAKGKYIFPLDNDDLFLDEGVLDEVSQEAEKGNFDIVEFIGAEHTNFIINPYKIKDSEYSSHKHNTTLYQPELGQFARKKNNVNGIYDVFLWGKCIKSDVYKKTVNLLGEDIYSKYIIWGEDLITSFVLFRVAKSFKFIKKYGIFRYKNKKTSSNVTPSQSFYLSYITYLDVILKYTNDTLSDKQYVVYVANRFLSFFLRRKKLNEENKIYYNSILNKIINCKYITANDKEKIKSKSIYRFGITK